jgi:hypothetical protein
MYVTIGTCCTSYSTVGGPVITQKKEYNIQNTTKCEINKVLLNCSFNLVHKFVDLCFLNMHF